MFIKDICENVAFFTRNKISGMQHDWGRFRQCDKWKRGLVSSIALGTIVAFVLVGAIGGFVFLYFIVLAFACQLFIVVSVIFAALAVYFTWLFICCVAKIEEEKNIKEFCEG